MKLATGRKVMRSQVTAPVEKSHWQGVYGAAGATPEWSRNRSLGVGRMPTPTTTPTTTTTTTTTPMTTPMPTLMPTLMPKLMQQQPTVFTWNACC